MSNLILIIWWILELLPKMWYIWSWRPHVCLFRSNRVWFFIQTAGICHKNFRAPRAVCCIHCGSICFLFWRAGQTAGLPSCCYADMHLQYLRLTPVPPHPLWRRLTVWSLLFWSNSSGVNPPFMFWCSVMLKLSDLKCTVCGAVEFCYI